MKVRFKTTGNEGTVTDTTYLPYEKVGTMCGTWHRVQWDDTLEQTWVPAGSVESIHP